MDLRQVVAGLLARDPVLSVLVMAYADRLATGPGRGPAPCFIVPTWGADRSPGTPPGHRVLTVEAHAPDTRCPDARDSIDTRDRRDALDAVLARVHRVLTDDRARSSLTARRLGSCPGLPGAGAGTVVGTVVRRGSWDTALVPPSGSWPGRRRLVPWPAPGAPVVVTRTRVPGTR